MPNVLDRAQADAVQLGSRGGCVAHMRPVESSADQPHPLGVPGRDGGGAFALLHAGSPCDGTGAAGSRTRASAEARAAVGAAGRSQGEAAPRSPIRGRTEPRPLSYSRLAAAPPSPAATPRHLALPATPSPTAPPAASNQRRAPSSAPPLPAT